MIAPFIVPFINTFPPQIYRFDVQYQPLSLTNNSPKLRYEMCHSALFGWYKALQNGNEAIKVCHMT